MGYESKILVVERSVCDWVEHPFAWGRQIAEYNLSKIGNCPDFFNAFDTEIDYELSVGLEETTNIDCYGDHMKSAKLEVLLPILKELEAKDHYRRLTPLIAMLEVFNASNEEEWCGRLEVVHYGY